MNFPALAASANVLMAPPRARDQGQWMKDGNLLLDVAVKAYRLAKARDYEALTPGLGVGLGVGARRRQIRCANAGLIARRSDPRSSLHQRPDPITIL